MRRWKYLVPVLFVIVMLTMASLACTVKDYLTNFSTPTPEPTTIKDELATLEHEMFLTAVGNASPGLPLPNRINAAWTSDSSQLSDIYTDNTVPTTPFSGLFGDMDQASTIQSIKNALPDLKFNWRMTITQNDWAAWAFDISGTFTQPLVTSNATLPPTHQPWFTTVQMLVHITPDGMIDKEYSSADMVAMMHEAGVAGYENVKVGDNALEKPMTTITPSTDSAAIDAAQQMVASAGNGPFFLWLPSDVPKDSTTEAIYHSPYGDNSNNVSEIEHKLLLLRDAHVEVPMIVREGNNIGMAFTYMGTVAFPVKFKNGITIPADNRAVEFSGVILGTVDANANGEAWVLFNRLDNPITSEKYGTSTGVSAPATRPAANITSTPSAEGTLPATAAFGANTSCSITAPQTANLRSGPGTSFAKAGSLNAGQSASIVGQAQSSDGKTWYQTADKTWVRSDLVTAVGDCASVPTVSQ